jgi:hypothetical protein
MGIDKLSNYWVINEEFPRYFSNKSDFKHLYDIISETKANIVFVDSLTRMAFGEIEDSSFCRNLGIILRDISKDCKTTMIVIHHTPKLMGGPISIDGVAGSRILGQEADFLIGVNKTLGGVRYIKDVAFRYAQEKDEVLEFKINDSLWIDPIGWTSEQSLLKYEDGRVNESSKDVIMDFMNASDKESITTAELCKNLVENKLIGRSILFSNLKSLVKDEKLLKLKNGQYSIPK